MIIKDHDMILILGGTAQALHKSEPYRIDPPALVALKYSSQLQHCLPVGNLGVTLTPCSPLLHTQFPRMGVLNSPYDPLLLFSPTLLFAFSLSLACSLVISSLFPNLSN